MLLLFCCRYLFSCSCQLVLISQGVWGPLSLSISIYISIYLYQGVWGPLSLPQCPAPSLDTLAHPRVQASVGREGGAGSQGRGEARHLPWPRGARHQAGQGEQT